MVIHWDSSLSRIVPAVILQVPRLNSIDNDATTVRWGKAMAFSIDKEAWYTSEEVAEMRGVSKSTMESERWRGGGIPYSKLGKRVFFRDADIDVYLAEHMVGSSSQILLSGRRCAGTST